MMLVHIDQTECAERLRNAWLKAIEDGVHTATSASPTTSTPSSARRSFTQAVIERLGEEPRRLGAVHFSHGTPHPRKTEPKKEKKEIVGVDVFLDWDEPGRNPDALGEKLCALNGEGLELKMITNRGVKVFPTGCPRPSAPTTGAAASSPIAKAAP
jgi:isocitrate dehydrogenase